MKWIVKARNAKGQEQTWEITGLPDGTPEARVREHFARVNPGWEIVQVTPPESAEPAPQAPTPRKAKP